MSDMKEADYDSARSVEGFGCPTIELFEEMPEMSIRRDPIFHKFFGFQRLNMHLFSVNDEYLDYKRVGLSKVYNRDYSDDIMEFLDFELEVEWTIRQNAKIGAQHLTRSERFWFRSKFNCLRKKKLHLFEEDVMLLKVKYIYHLEGIDVDSRYNECQAILRMVDLDKFHTSLRRNQLLAECSIIKAIILKKKSGSYYQSSGCSKFIQFLAESRFNQGYSNYNHVCRAAFENGVSMDPDYFMLLKSHFDCIDVPVPRHLKFKNVYSYQGLDGLIEKAKLLKTKELRHVVCCLDHDMPGKRSKWLQLLDELGATVAECWCHKEKQKDYHVTRDRDRCCVDRTAIDIMDTTITVIIEDLINVK